MSIFIVYAFLLSLFVDYITLSIAQFVKTSYSQSNGQEAQIPTHTYCELKQVSFLKAIKQHCLTLLLKLLSNAHHLRLWGYNKLPLDMWANFQLEASYGRTAIYQMFGKRTVHKKQFIEFE